MRPVQNGQGVGDCLGDLPAHVDCQTLGFLRLPRRFDRVTGNLEFGLRKPGLGHIGVGDYGVPLALDPKWRHAHLKPGACWLGADVVHREGVGLSVKDRRNPPACGKRLLVDARRVDRLEVIAPDLGALPEAPAGVAARAPGAVRRDNAALVVNKGRVRGHGIEGGDEQRGKLDGGVRCVSNLYRSNKQSNLGRAAALTPNTMFIVL